MMAQDAAHLLRGALTPDLMAIADDVVVLDSGSVDDTGEVARSLGARVIDAPWPDGGFGDQQTRAAHAVRTDWVLILDADEIVGSDLLSALPNLIRTRRHTGWWLPRRWLIRLGDDIGYLAGNPHWPDFQPRLARRLPGLEYVGAIHQTLAAATPGSWGIERHAALIHVDLLLASREEREAKVAERLDVPGFAGTEGFYLWEDRPAKVRRLPDGDIATRRGLALLGVNRPCPTDGER